MKTPSKKTHKRRLIKYFLQGLLYISPLAITIFILYSMFRFIDGLLRSSLRSWFYVDIPGLGLVIILVLVTLLGFLGQTMLAQPIKKQVTRFMKQSPFLQSIYMTVKDFVEAFLGQEKKFVHPVLVKLNRTSDMEKIGFLTQTDLSELKLKDKVAVYFPQSYSWSGDLFIVPAENVTPLDISPGDAMKFAVTGGVTKVSEERNIQNS